MFEYIREGIEFHVSWEGKVPFISGATVVNDQDFNSIDYEAMQVKGDTWDEFNVISAVQAVYEEEILREAREDDFNLARDFGLDF